MVAASDWKNPFCWFKDCRNCTRACTSYSSLTATTGTESQRVSTGWDKPKKKVKKRCKRKQPRKGKLPDEVEQERTEQPKYKTVPVENKKPKTNIGFQLIKRVRSNLK